MAVTKQFVFAFLSFLLAATSTARAALVLQVDTYTTDQLSFTISGTFDTATIGQSEGWLAIKNDWSNNVGIHTELFSTAPAILVNTITIGGVAPETFVQGSPTETMTWADNIFFANPLGTETPFAAGTAVAGSITLFAVGAFDPSDIATLELVSGFNRPLNHDDWARLEARAVGAQAVPEPATIAIWGVGAVGCALIARRRRNRIS
jgi:hypothetical protein